MEVEGKQSWKRMKIKTGRTSKKMRGLKVGGEKYQEKHKSKVTK